MKKLLAALLMSLPIVAVGDAMDYRTMIPEVPGAMDIYDAYVQNGYTPTDAMILSNWDVMVGLNKMMGTQVSDQKMIRDIQSIRDTYTKAQ